MRTIYNHFDLKATLHIIALCVPLFFLSCSKNEEVKNRDPEKVVLLKPANELLEVDIIKPTLEWQPASDPDGDAVVYDLYLDTETVPKTKVISDLKATSYKLQTDLQIDMTYYWRVIAKDGKGGESESDVYAFTTRERTIEEAVLGKWKIEMILKDGTPEEIDACLTYSYFQFNADGSYAQSVYGGSPCQLDATGTGTYSIGADWVLVFEGIGEDGKDISIKISSITQNTMKLLLPGGYVYVLRKS